ncbi:MAG: signal recognition particle-docking protein FtsY [Simkaniaceae bacterium]
MLTRLKSSFQKFKNALTKTRSSLVHKITSLFKKPISPETLEELEQILYESDLGSELVDLFIRRIEKNVDLQQAGSKDVLEEMKSAAKEILSYPPRVTTADMEEINERPYVILMVGINGSGKTTSCAKLARYFQNQGKKVLLGAADTFRAAAIEQLALWADRLQVPIVKGRSGGDPSAVVYDALEAAKARGIDVVILDTAGRLESKSHLMEQLAKLKRVSGKLVENAPHEILLVLDATTGQNAVEQAKTFHEFTPLNGIVLSKIDGTAKGGIILSIYQKMGIPVRYLGLGEKVEDFSVFDPKAYAEALFASE